MPSGLTGGVNSATLTGSDADAINVESKTGGAGGLYANIYLGSRFSVEGQLLFQGQGFTGADTANVEYDVAQGYIVFPMLLKVYFGKLNIFAGPAISWEVSCSVDADNTAGECDTSNSPGSGAASPAWASSSAGWARRSTTSRASATPSTT